MPEPRPLGKAPIVEAIVDLRVQARTDLQADEFAGLQDILGDRFPNVEKRIGGNVTIVFGPSGPKMPLVEELGLQGYLFRSDDAKLIAQFRVDGFTLNRLRPYTSWKELLPVAMELWEQYCAVAKPRSVTRLALRYINRIQLPADLTWFGEYLRAPPVVPRELPQNIGAFFSRVTIHDPTKGVSAHILQTLEANPEEPGPTLLLDIDTFHDDSLEPGDSAIASLLGELHDFKNLIFFEYLTENTLRRLA